MKDFKGTTREWVKTVEKSNIIVKIPIRVYGERIIYNNLVFGTITSDDCGVETCCCVEEHANAKLVAAAPDLLKALQEIAKHCNEEEKSGAFYKTAQAAINKALGE